MLPNWLEHVLADMGVLHAGGVPVTFYATLAAEQIAFMAGNCDAKIAVIDGASEFRLLTSVFLPMNWGITSALAIITFIAAWNYFLWPFLIASTDAAMTVTVGIVQVHEAFGVQYARNLAGAMLAAFPVAAAYLIFQRRVTEAVMLSAGIKG